MPRSGHGHRDALAAWPTVPTAVAVPAGARAAPPRHTSATEYRRLLELGLLGQSLTQDRSVAPVLRSGRAPTLWVDAPADGAVTEAEASHVHHHRRRCPQVRGCADRRGIALARALGAHVHLVSAYPKTPARSTARTLPPHRCRAVDGRARPVEQQREHDARPSRRPGQGDPPGRARTSGADLIVVGNKGMKGKGRFLGSVPNDIAHQATCAVLIVSST